MNYIKIASRKHPGAIFIRNNFRDAPRRATGGNDTAFIAKFYPGHQVEAEACLKFLNGEN